MSVCSASFLQYRYGWKLGFPVYLITFGFSYDRVQVGAHSLGDVLLTGALVNLIAYLVTPRITTDTSYCLQRQSHLNLKKEGGNHH